MSHITRGWGSERRKGKTNAGVSSQFYHRNIISAANITINICTIKKNFFRIDVYDGNNYLNFNPYVMFKHQISH
jgi:hypothetical protein